MQIVFLCLENIGVAGDDATRKKDLRFIRSEQDACQDDRVVNSVLTRWELCCRASYVKVEEM